MTQFYAQQSRAKCLTDKGSSSYTINKVLQQNVLNDYQPNASAVLHNPQKITSYPVIVTLPSKSFIQQKGSS